MLNLTQRYYLCLQNHQQVLLTSVSIILLLFCKQISGYFCDYDTNYWFNYFIVVERLSMLLLLISCSEYLNKKAWVGYELLLCFLMQDFIDRVFFNIKVFNINDLIGISLIIIRLIIKTNVRLKK